MYFDEWYIQVSLGLKSLGKCAPYKAAWLEFYERGLSVEEAMEIGPWELL